MISWLLSLIAWLIPLSSPANLSTPVEPTLWVCQADPNHPYSISYASVCVDRGRRDGRPGGH